MSRRVPLYPLIRFLIRFPGCTRLQPEEVPCQMVVAEARA